MRRRPQPAAPSPVVVAESARTACESTLPARKSTPDATCAWMRPHTAVRVNKDSGKVAVRAPYTDVKVDPDKGQVRVRAPYVNLDIRW